MLAGYADRHGEKLASDLRPVRTAPRPIRADPKPPYPSDFVEGGSPPGPDQAGDLFYALIEETR